MYRFRDIRGQIAFRITEVRYYVADALILAYYAFVRLRSDRTCCGVSKLSQTP